MKFFDEEFVFCMGVNLVGAFGLLFIEKLAGLDFSLIVYVIWGILSVPVGKAIFNRK